MSSTERIPTDERIVNLALALSHASHPLSAQDIRFDPHIGYDSSLDEAAFLRSFNRDKDRLKEAGFIIELTAENKYFIDPKSSFMHELELSAAERMTLQALSFSFLDDPQFPFQEDLRYALNKLKGSSAQEIDLEEEDRLLWEAEDDEDIWGDTSLSDTKLSDTRPPDTKPPHTKLSDTRPPDTRSPHIKASSKDAADNNTGTAENEVTGDKGATTQGTDLSVGLDPKSRLSQLIKAAYASVAQEEQLLEQERLKSLGFLNSIEEALLRRKNLYIQYGTDKATRADQGSSSIQGSKSKQASNLERCVQAAGLFKLSQHWYLLAYDLSKLDWRTFRLDRIQDLRINTKKPKSPDFEAFDIKVQDFIGLPFQYQDGPVQSGRIAIKQEDAWRAPDLTQSKGQLIVQDDGSLIWEIDFKGCAELARFCAAQDIEMRPMSPESLRKHYAQGLLKLKQMHKPKSKTQRTAQRDAWSDAQHTDQRAAQRDAWSDAQGSAQHKAKGDAHDTNHKTEQEG